MQNIKDKTFLHCCNNYAVSIFTLVLFVWFCEQLAGVTCVEMFPL